MNSPYQSVVTIGIPVYNEEKHIKEAISSSAPQCKTVWVSDNASTDGSAAICEQLSHEYPNVHLVRQPHNIGAASNFKYLLDKADTPYFMWLGGHDALPEDYVGKLLQLLENCPEAVLAYGASSHVDVDGKPIGVYDYFYSEQLADKLPATRVLALIRDLGDCSLIHGLFRTEALRTAWNDFGSDLFLGSDQVLLGLAAIQGPFLYAPETHLIRRDAHPEDNQQKQLQRMGLLQPRKEQLNLREMQRRLYGLTYAVSAGGGLFGILYRIKARFILVKRLGPFGNTFLSRKLDLALFFLTLPLHKMPLVACNKLCKFPVNLVKALSSGIKKRWENFNTVNAIRRMQCGQKIIVGSLSTKQAGWISTDYPLLDLTDARTFSALLAPSSVSNFLAEHVWEHLSLDDGYKACQNCFEYLRPGGLIRIAVPDGYHPDPDYIAQVKPGGYGLSADDHKVLYNYRMLTALLENAGFTVKLLEYFDEQGEFHHEEWNAEEGFIKRSTRFDPRNTINPTAYTSLIVDARKPSMASATNEPAGSDAPTV